MTDGIFDGFEDYRTPTEDDYRNTLTSGLVVFDANVLLNLYRFNSTTRGDLIKVMQGLGESLWIPHQVMREFWRNRESVIDQLGETPKESLTRLAKAQQEAEDAVRAWSNRIYLPDGQRDGLLNGLNGAFNTVRQTISEQDVADAHSHDTNKDAIVHTLNSILSNRKGSALSPEDHAAAVTEAERRITAQEPPGYLDKEKSDPDERAGDYLVWKQVLLEAERRSCDVLLVTSDVKPDWWRRAKGQRRGPRLELMAEFRRGTGHRLFMLTPSELIRRADSLTNVHVNPKSAEDIERVEKSHVELVPYAVQLDVVAEIYRRINPLGWENSRAADRSRQLTRWVEDPAIGGVLSDYLTSSGIRVWIKDVALRQHQLALNGAGPFAELVAMRHLTSDEIIAEACGPDWRVQPESQGIRPFHCLAFNGVDTRFVCWGPERSFRDLLWAAMNRKGPTLGKPLIVALYDGIPTARDRYSEMAAGADVDVVYLQQRLSPNPAYKR